MGVLLSGAQQTKIFEAVPAEAAAVGVDSPAVATLMAPVAVVKVLAEGISENMSLIMECGFIRMFSKRVEEFGDQDLKPISFDARFHTCFILCHPIAIPRRAIAVFNCRANLFMISIVP